MKLDHFQNLVECGDAPDPSEPYLLALWLDAHGKWDSAHETIQPLKGVDSARVHAYLHRKEGDLANARYWYDRAGIEPVRHSLQEEWTELVHHFVAGE